MMYHRVGWSRLVGLRNEPMPTDTQFGYRLRQLQPNLPLPAIFTLIFSEADP